MLVIFLYGKYIINTKRSIVKNTLKYAGSILGKSIVPTAPIPAIFAPILRTIAGAPKPIVKYNTHLG
jgi:hypothetical protein